MNIGALGRAAIALVAADPSCGKPSQHPDAVGPPIDAATVSFTPTSGPIGTLVTVTGADFSTARALAVNGTQAILVSASPAAAVGFVMPGTTSGSVTVTTSSGVLTAGGTFDVTATGIPATQQGTKLVGTGVTSNNESQGAAVAVSADGNTAIVGAPTVGVNIGHVWVFTRSGGGWTQEASLFGSGSIGGPVEGGAVALSADGNTALVGGSGDGQGATAGTGAVWVFTRAAGTWTQLQKLVVFDEIGTAAFGYSVALGADGNTALVGGWGDNSQVGAAWVLARSGSTWSEQKLVATDAIGAARQGVSVALSADGTTAIVGGSADNSGAGAAWVFTRSGSTWSQQGPKLVGTGAVGGAQQGDSVAISADGNTVLVGGPSDSSSLGAAWVFTRAGGTWTQQGQKLVGTGAVGSFPLQGGHAGCALSADGNTALVGGSGDSSNFGATWVFARAGGAWSQQGNKLVGTGAVGTLVSQGYAVALAADGNTAVVGGEGDSSYTGATWVFTP